MKKVLVLQEELVLEILKRLPVIFLYRCMSVCKSWHSLIISSHFVSTHLNYQKAISNGNVVPKTYPFYYGWVKQPGDDINPKWTLKFYVFCDDGFTFRQLCECDCAVNSVRRVVGYCDGMVCLYSHEKPKRWFTLWNASQKKYIEVDFPHDITKREPSFCGFGVDAYRNDYKVVMVIESWERDEDDRAGPSYVCYVYSLRMGSWRHVSDSLLGNGKISFRGTHLGGVIHWAMSGNYISSGLMPSFSILTFNLADETFGQITLPEEMISGDENGSPDWYDMEYYGPMTIKRHGKDCLSVYHFDATCSWMYLWVMEKYGIVESWRAVLKISGDDIKQLHDVRMNGEIVVSTMKDLLVSVVPETEKRELISSQQRSYVGTYVESLVLLGPLREALEETQGLRGD